MSSPVARKEAGGPRWALVALLLLWLALVLAGYYLVRNAFLQLVLAELGAAERWLRPAISPAAWARTLLDGLAALWIAIAALGLGRALLDRLSLTLSWLEYLLFAWGAGFGLLALLVLALGLIGLLNAWFLALLLALFTLASGRGTLAYLRQGLRLWPDRWSGLYLAVSLGLALSLALLPETSWDGLFYHLTAPKLYLAAGRIQPLIDVPHFNFPALFEMLFLLALAIRGEVAAVLLHYFFVLLLAGLVFVMARRQFGLKDGRWAVLFLFAVPMVLSLSSWAYNDLPLAFYEVAALAALLHWRSGQNDLDRPDGTFAARPLVHSPLFLAALFSGLAMGHKYTSFVGPLALGFLVVWWYRRRLSAFARPLLFFSGLALLVAAPWFLKNLAFTGNPVYPFVFDGLYWDEFRAAAYAESGTGIAYRPDSCTETDTDFLVGQHPTGCDFDPLYWAGQLLLLPYNLTLGIRDASRDGVTGPLTAVFLPLLIAYAFWPIGRRRPAALNPVLFFVLIQYLFWAIGVSSSAALWQSRLLLPAFVALCPVMAWLLNDLAYFDHPRFSLQRQLKLVSALVLFVGLILQFMNWLPYQPWAYLSGAESESAYLQRRLGAHYQAVQLLNEQLPPDATVFFLWEPRSYYCEVDCRPDSILDAYGHLRFVHGDAAGVARAFAKEGITHVLLFRSGLDFVLQANSPTEEPLPEPPLLQALLADHLRLIGSAGGAYELYLVRE